MTNEQAIYIRARFRSTKGWDELQKVEPVFCAFIEGLPDITTEKRHNWMVMEMYNDAKKEAEKLFPNKSLETD